MHKGFHLKTLLAGSASSDNRIFSLALWCDLVTVSLVASNRVSINLDTVTVYLNRCNSHTLSLFMEIRYFRVIDRSRECCLSLSRSFITDQY